VTVTDRFRQVEQPVGDILKKPGQMSGDRVCVVHFGQNKGLQVQRTTQLALTQRKQQTLIGGALAHAFHH
jgi:hypothetical protein